MGVRSTFYRIATIFGSGVLVYLAGQLEVSLKDVRLGWTIAMGVAALVFAVVFIFHWFVLPSPSSDSKKAVDKLVKTLHVEVIHSYFSQEKSG